MSAMIKSLALTLLLIGASMATAKGAPYDVSSRLQVQVPKELFKKDGYDHREALFGHHPYGGSITQKVYFTDTDLCDPNRIDKASGYPSRPIESETGRQEEWPSPFILMANRGGTCSFVQKARNAQHMGAVGLLIADNICLCADTECMSSLISNDDTKCQSTVPVMTDDGSGGDITIPTLFMFKQDADTIKAEVKDRDSIVQMEMSWSPRQSNSKVRYELWTVPTDEVSKIFQKDWKDIAMMMGDNLHFTPRQYVYDGIKTGCRKDGRNKCLNLCTNEGRYCATDPDNDLEHGISGADVVTEELRRICIWNVHGESDGDDNVYWDYIAEFVKTCNSDWLFTNMFCINNAMEHAKVDKKRFYSCFTGGTKKYDAVNSLLEREIGAASRKGVVVLPTMFVNSAPLRGALTTTTVFNAVCAGFTLGSEPSLCSKCYGCSDIGQCIKEGDNSGGGGDNGNGGATSKEFFGMLLLIVFGHAIAWFSVLGVAGYWHWRTPIDGEVMRDEGRGILAEGIVLATINRKQETKEEHQPLQ